MFCCLHPYPVICCCCNITSRLWWIFITSTITCTLGQWTISFPGSFISSLDEQPWEQIWSLDWPLVARCEPDPWTTLCGTTSSNPRVYLYVSWLFTNETWFKLQPGLPVLKPHITFNLPASKHSSYILSSTVRGDCRCAREDNHWRLCSRNIQSIRRLSRVGDVLTGLWKSMLRLLCRPGGSGWRMG